MIGLKDKTFEELETMAKTARPLHEAEALVKEICDRKYLDSEPTAQTDTPTFYQGDIVEIEKHDLNCLYEALRRNEDDTGFAYNDEGSYCSLASVGRLLGRVYPD